MERRELFPALCALTLISASPAAAQLRAGAATVDISPQTFPVIINCGFTERQATRVKIPLRARALVLENGGVRVGLVVVDSCMMPRELIDRAKQLAAEKSGIRPANMLVSATHTHSAPAAMACLGSRAETAYAAALPGKIAAAIVAAAARLEPARAGWAVVEAGEHTHTRRWIYRPEAMLTDPFGNRTVRANMHPGYQNPAAVTPAGPSDAALTVLSVQSAAGRPLALLANYSQHYYGDNEVSADYQGLFGDTVGQALGAGSEFVGMMSQGTSGDQMWMDYSQPRAQPGLERYTAQVVARAVDAYRLVRYETNPPLRMAEMRLVLGRRVPDAARLQWARALVATLGERLPKTHPEIYAREAIYLSEEPRRELTLQALRLGSLGITAMPNEVFAITGLKIKQQSPLAATMNITLANGAEGYIPPPEQHRLGGYTTWAARTAGLETGAEPRIVEAVLTLLEQVSGRQRRAVWSRPAPPGAVAYWHLDGLTSQLSGRARLEGLYALGVDGYAERAVYLAGGSLVAELPARAAGYRVAYWFWDALGDKRWAQRQVETTGGTLRIGPLEGKIDEVTVFAK
jgi:hypothetical protein